MRRAALVLTACLLLGSGGLLPGCSSGLTGGSIPPGGSRAAGFVVRGDSATTPLSGARIRFEPITTASRQSGGSLNLGGGGDPPPPPDFGGGGGSNGGGGTVVTPPQTDPAGTVETTSNDAGEFQAEGVRPGLNKLTVTPPAGSGLDRIEYQIDAPANDSYWIVSAPLPINLSTAGLSGIEVRPTLVDLQVGQSVQIEVHLQGGAPPLIVPSYLLRGGVGRVNAQGRLTATRPGRGELTVIVGPHSQRVPVVTRSIE